MLHRLPGFKDSMGEGLEVMIAVVSTAIALLWLMTDEPSYERIGVVLQLVNQLLQCVRREK
jgi:hypothetical protein